MNYQDIIGNFQEMMDSMNKVAAQTQEFINSTQKMARSHRPIVNKTIQQLEQTITASLQNQLTLIDSQFQFIEIVRSRVQSPAELENLSKLEDAFHTKQNQFKIMLKSFHSTC